MGFKYILFNLIADITGTEEPGGFDRSLMIWVISIVIFITLGIFLYLKLSLEIRVYLIKILAAALLMTEVIRTALALYYNNYRIDSMLPLHLCGIMVFVEFLAVYYDKEFLKEFSYSCGMPGAFIGLANPDASGFSPGSFQYLLYILRHGLLVVIPILLILSKKFKPKAGNFYKSYISLCILAILDALINFKLHSNYLFISKAPPLKLLAGFYKTVGYPGYVGLLIISSLLVIILMYLPWYIERKFEDKKQLLVEFNK